REFFLRAAGIALPLHPAPTDRGDLIQEIVTRETSTPAWEPLAVPGPLAVVLLRTHPRYPGMVNHLGVCLGSVNFLHIMRARRAVIERLDSPLWRDRIEGFYRWT